METDFNLPLRTPDLVAHKVIFWGYLKDEVIATKPQTLHARKETIRQVIRGLQPEMLHVVI